MFIILKSVLHILNFILANFLPILIAVVFYTLGERKAMAAIQRRLGPSYITKHGIAQPLADGVKALLKEAIIPRRANKFIFCISPAIALIIGYGNWSLIPFDPLNTAQITSVNNFSDFSLSLFLILALSSISVYAVILSGWSSNSKYAFLGSIRSTAQMLSYEISMTLIIVPIIILNQTVNLSEIVKAQESLWNVWILWPLTIIFFIVSLAETNRAPFDLPEAEAELVAGYNVEYSGMMFAMFFLAEYSSMLLISTLNVIFFWGGWLPLFFSTDLFSLPSVSFGLKVGVYAFLFVLVRAALPRYRYDQLMAVGYLSLLPIALALIAYVSGLYLVLL